ncbi:DNA-directed DNA polymerase, family B, multifunctional domain [Dillenia turbinata]|uniref:DNA polymerase n=1 Tax=Dillenia turbinata TaxID=194707 RepID=A0AAN8UK78_9MAGN
MGDSQSEAKALPYLYVPCSDISSDPNQQGNACITSISLALEKALKLKGNAGVKRQHVHGCSLVKARKFYGYHSSEELVVAKRPVLQGGDVLGRSLQPHEAHIPFLLQFLIDYNLYGMGHLHLSKIKFRHPVPEVHYRKKAYCDARYLQETGNDSSADFQADSSKGAVSDSPIWITSTVPFGWSWASPSECGVSSDQGVAIAKRQSACQLEGDATVDEILNQQLKMYMSFSQTSTDVKMVQSLIPIWEEEYERTGIHETFIRPDPGKPLPGDVLKTLSDGLEYEKLYMEMCSTAVELCAVEPGRESLLTRGLLSGEDGGKMSNEIVSRQFLVEVKASGILQDSERKDVEKEAMGLLRWLASSQAAEDMNSDDELVPETILSPLMAATSLDKVLENANVAYENESQQECQDILDSVENFTGFDEAGERDSPSTRGHDSSQNSPGKMIAQVDGSSDERCPSPHSYGSSQNLTMKNKSRISKHMVPQDTNASFPLKQKRHKPLWGSLPLSAQKVNSDLETVNFNTPNSQGRETIDAKVDFCYDTSLATKDVNIHYTNDKSMLLGCSMRDLMRRKRCHRLEAPDYGTSKIENVSENDEGKRCLDSPDLGVISSKNQVEVRERSQRAATCAFQVLVDEEPSVDKGVQQECDATLSSMATGPVEDELLNRDDYSYMSEHEGRNLKLRPEKSLKTFEIKYHGTAKSLMHPESHGGHEQGTGYNDSASFAESLALVSKGEGPAEFGMTMSRKPPVMVSTDETYNDVPLVHPIPNCPSPGDISYRERNAQSKSADEVLPFFVSDCLEEEVARNNLCRKNDVIMHEEAAIGVPIHFQNDGTFLYLLTPVLSPPSADHVAKWLLDSDFDSVRVSKGTSKEILIASSTESSALEGKHLQDRLNQENPENLDTKVNTSNKRVETVHLNDVQDSSQISGPDRRPKPTPLSQIGFRDPASVGGGQQLTLLSIEIQAESRGDLLPDPRFDAINIIALAIQEDSDSVSELHVLIRGDTEHFQRNPDGICGCNVCISPEEKQLFDHFVKVIDSFDPDILMGWEIQGSSLGFLAERAAYLGIGLLNRISRTPSESKMNTKYSGTPDHVKEDVLPEELISDHTPVESAIIGDEWGRTHASGVHVGGRIVLNVWRLMRSEIKLNMYTLEAVAQAVLRRKVPSIHSKILKIWFSSGPGRARFRCIEYVTGRAKLNLEIMNQLDMVNRTSELARVFGIDFFSVLSRGSQYRVESMFLRLAHTQNYLAISPGNQQVASQPAMECLPLVMEPESGFYSDPVIVLDFQSLYPSMIIAYNLCFCTCLGKVLPSKRGILGVSPYSPDIQALKDLKLDLLLTPNGVMYVPSKVRKGVLPRLLEEILTTRIMVKKAMKKLTPSQQVLYRIFNARQLALKLIANVTYGYTAAGFSGRMPCAELADSIVQCGRRTLETAISFVNTHDKWKARVIYGDTDSMFVLLKGRTCKEAFQIGNEIAAAITALNPEPVTLKMEKVYHPCFLLTKKRYVGYSYESPEQIEPVFDAKGIETVRRDTCDAVAKTMEQSLRLFFEHQDLSEVKDYLQRQWTRTLSGKVSLQDFVFAKEVRLGTYSTRNSSSLPPAAIVATKAMRADPRAEPRYADRIPYVVVHGEPGARLVDMVVDPLDLLAIDSPYRLNAVYYITKQIIPALQRAFGLVGADLRQWFLEMPRPVREPVAKRNFAAQNSHRTRIDFYYLSQHCILCGELVQGSAHICEACSKRRVAATAAVTARTSKLERDIQHLVSICRHCGGGDWIVESGVKCISLACPVFYERRKVQKELQSVSSSASESGLYPKCMVEWF